mmetsp:Transcript_33405/g.73663  ORF Transcript_33405/g.73663 Transcript_33405/m.73663 type:complete len:84 (+) Transcript_33405:81-332(+)|eukprot:CAMPEP_0178520858 /NCGR_PEP_ID=MMETSP0696-20121128/27634_1 /TAXON_ID=265572 /ORGANISM="Extubocellulus spinifer, Strain CCMP396" /LENGTH=83 /DNA_ID=CAMNT_0020151755 /DNA_START=14 /DNA_END=265 /DNA_ORIENTATION=+
MALRRPPTRVELKADDIVEYEQIMSERQLAAEDAAATKGGGSGGGPNDSAYSGAYSSKTGKTPTSAAKRKANIAERIGAGRAG